MQMDGWTATSTETGRRELRRAAAQLSVVAANSLKPVESGCGAGAGGHHGGFS